MRKCTFTLAFGALLQSSLSYGAFANLSRLDNSGDCGSLSTEITEEKAYDDWGRGFEGESLRVTFNEFILRADSQGWKERNCRLGAGVTVPAGYRFRPTLAAAEGFYSIQPQGQSTGGIKVSYVVDPSGQKAERENAKPFTGQGDILCKAELKDPRFSTCYNRPNVVNLTTDLKFWLDQKGQNASVMQLDASRTKTSLKWNWQFQSCENFFDQRWFSTNYLAYNGQRYNARIFFDLTNGRYESSAGFTGYFNNIQYSEDGLEMTANWSTDSQSGWMKFRMEEVSTGRFRGEWGDSSNFKADWYGSYENVGAVVGSRTYHSFHTPNFSACLDAGSNLGNGTLVQAKPCNYKGGQRFYAPNVFNQDFFHIKSSLSGKCVTADPKNPRQKLVNQICDGGANDGWEFYVRGQSPFRLRHKASGLCMLIRGQDITLGNCEGEATYLTWSRQ